MENNRLKDHYLEANRKYHYGYHCLACYRASRNCGCHWGYRLASEARFIFASRTRLVESIKGGRMRKYAEVALLTVMVIVVIIVASLVIGPTDALLGF